MAESHSARATAARAFPQISALFSQTKKGPKIIAVTGATGLVGKRLVRRLTAQGDAVRVLTRNTDKARKQLPDANVDFVAPDNWEAALADCYGVVNLAGEPIATRWDARIKKEIKDSRVKTTRRLSDAINALPKKQRPEVFVSSSAVGFYGTSTTGTFSEESSSGGDYLAEVCREWEAAAEEADTRVVVVRTGIVLAKDGGALAKMIPVFNMFGGGPVGTGEQWMSWVHVDDLVALLCAALTSTSFRGVYNGTAPNPVRMNELCSQLGSVMGRPSWLPVPDFALQGLLGEGATVVSQGQRVLPAKAQKAGFEFQYAEVGPAITNILK